MTSKNWPTARLFDEFQSSIFDAVNVVLTDIFRETATGKTIIKEKGELYTFVTSIQMTAEGMTTIFFDLGWEYPFVARVNQFSDLWLVSGGGFRGEYRPDDGEDHPWLPF